MIEIVCPSCEARYQLPEGSIGPEGRKVSCSSCSYKWRALPEGAAPVEAPFSDEWQMPEEAAPPSEAAPSYAVPPSSEAPQSYDMPPSAEAVASQEPPSPDESPSSFEPGAESAAESAAESVAAAAAATTASMAAIASAASDSEAPSTTPPPATGDRDEQMAAIRKMLSDLKEGAAAEPEPEPEERPAPTTSAPPMRMRAEDDDDGRDQLKSRIDELSKAGRTAKGQPEQSSYDAARLRRMHEKRAKKLQRSRERRKKSGAFMTGFTLVCLVAATMVGLYMLRPQIIAASPEMAPALDQYVVAVDRYRVQLDETTAEWREWMVKRFAELKGEEPKTE